MSKPEAGSDGETISTRARLQYLFIRLAVLGLVFAGFYITRPLWHGIVYGILYSPGLAVFGGGTVLTAVILWLLPSSVLTNKSGSWIGQILTLVGVPPEVITEIERFGGRKLQLFVALTVFFAIGGFLIGLPAETLEQRTLAQQTMASAEEVSEFPQANAENPRVVPRRVADVTTRGSVSYRQHRLGTSDIARTESGSLAWSYAIQPDGLRNQIVENQRGVLVTDMTRMDDRQITVYEEPFTYGEGMFLYRSADWNLKLTDYVTKYDDDAVEFSHDGRPYMYYPKTGHQWHLFPVPHTTPMWDGGALVHPDGTIDHLTPEEARESTILDGQRLYPLTVTRAEMSALGYRNGIINQLPVVGAHEGQVELARLPSRADNEQPFVIDLEGERLTYVTAMEPYGEDTRGLDEVWFLDARTGTYTFFGTEEQTLTGPERAMGIARSSDSRTNWGQNFVITEPVPVTVDGSLWWHVKVSPTDFTDVTRNVFVNAETSRAVEIQSDAEVRAFINGTLNEQDQVVDRDDETDGEGIIYYILITDEDGNVIDRIPVRRGQETAIVNPEDQRVRTNQTVGGE